MIWVNTWTYEKRFSSMAHNFAPINTKLGACSGRWLSSSCQIWRIEIESIDTNRESRFKRRHEGFEGFEGFWNGTLILFASIYSTMGFCVSMWWLVCMVTIRLSGTDKPTYIEGSFRGSNGSPCHFLALGISRERILALLEAMLGAR